MLFCLWLSALSGSGVQCCRQRFLICGESLNISLNGAYTKALPALEEFAFQWAIIQRLLRVLSNFQSAPTYLQGDGGLDGHSHKGSRGYCCYGTKYDAAKTPLQRSKELVIKFSSDLPTINKRATLTPHWYKTTGNPAIARCDEGLPKSFRPPL
jgi:hypothetical protein